MDLPRAEIRYRGLRAVRAAVIRRWDRFGTWFRPRAAPLLITALATLCMLAALDLIAHDFRRLSATPARPLPVIYLMSMDRPDTVIPVELAPMPPEQIRLPVVTEHPELPASTTELHWVR